MKKHTYYMDDCRPVNIKSNGVFGRRTAVFRDTHVCLREYYVHGGGQLCRGCFADHYSQAQAGQKINEQF